MQPTSIKQASYAQDPPASPPLQRLLSNGHADWTSLDGPAHIMVSRAAAPAPSEWPTMRSRKPGDSASAAFSGSTVSCSIHRAAASMPKWLHAGAQSSAPQSCTGTAHACSGHVAGLEAAGPVAEHHAILVHHMVRLAGARQAREHVLRNTARCQRTPRVLVKLIAQTGRQPTLTEFVPRMASTMLPSWRSRAIT